MVWDSFVASAAARRELVEANAHLELQPVGTDHIQAGFPRASQVRPRRLRNGAEMTLAGISSEVGDLLHRTFFSLGG